MTPDTLDPLREMRHRLRSPLAIVYGYASLLEAHAAQGTLDETAVVEWARAMQLETERLDALIGELAGQPPSKRPAPVEARAIDAHTTVPSSDQAISILVVDDEPGLREFVSVTLKLAGFRPLLVGDGAQVADSVLRDKPDLVLMDLTMPSMSGLAALKHLRGLGSSVPVIMLTARDQQTDKIEAFDAGADDYLVKPFNARELVARVSAVLRRTRSTAADAAAEQVFAVGELTLVPGNHTAVVAGREVALTRTEYALLLSLARGAGRVFTPAELLVRVWGPEYRDQPEILRTNMYRLRQKLELDPSQPRHLCTRSGVGYYLAA